MAEPSDSGTLPLSASLSAAFVAFTIEADNAAEQRIPHKTTAFGAPGGGSAVWLCSLAMWFNCLGPLAEAGGTLSAAELRTRARMGTNLDGMRRWGFVTLDGVGRVPRGSVARPRPGPRSVLALTERGQAAERLWRSLPGEIEGRWRERFGAEPVDRLRAALLVVARRDDEALPDFLPIGGLEAALGAGSADAPARGPAARDADARLPLVSLLARVLMRYALDWQTGTRLPLVGWADLLRVLDDSRPVPLRELTRLTGIAKETLAVLSGRLEHARCLRGEPLSGAGRGRQLRLTERGVRARDAAQARIAATDAEWSQRHGGALVAELRDALAALVGDGTRDGSPLWPGIAAPEGGWRSQLPERERLPWYPMVSHRGGYPDGA